jgi:hypothetical protein
MYVPEEWNKDIRQHIAGLIIVEYGL